MKRITLLCVVALLGLSGCESMDGYSDEPTVGVAAANETIAGAGLPTGDLNYVISTMALQLANNSIVRNTADTRIAVGSFVSLQNFDEADKLGIALGENMVHEMHVRGFGVVDFKTREFLKVRPSGDFVFSRDIGDLKRTYNVHFFLAGTITRNSDGAMINARLVQTDSSLVVATAQGFIPNKSLDRTYKDRTREVEKMQMGPTIKLR